MHLLLIPQLAIIAYFADSSQDNCAKTAQRAWSIYGTFLRLYLGLLENRDRESYSRLHTVGNNRRLCLFG